MRTNRANMLLTLLVLLGTTITAQAWDRGKVERFATLPPGEAYPEGICRRPRWQRLRCHRGGEQAQRRVQEHSLCLTRTANTCGQFTLPAQAECCWIFASIQRMGS